MTDDCCSCVHDNFSPHSGEEMNVGLSSSEHVATNLKFSDESNLNTYSVSYVEDKTRTSEDTHDVDLGRFFGRPVKILEEEWGTGSVLSTTFNPWQLFFQNTRVWNRISNYNLLRSKLHIRVILNGNGFQYGRAILAYNPLDGLDNFKPTAFVSNDITQLSQLPHVYINPTTSQGGEMTLPFSII